MKIKLLALADVTALGVVAINQPAAILTMLSQLNLTRTFQFVLVAQLLA